VRRDAQRLHNTHIQRQPKKMKSQPTSLQRERRSNESTPSQCVATCGNGAQCSENILNMVVSVLKMVVLGPVF
jgi:hypothetical protein